MRPICKAVILVCFLTLSSAPLFGQVAPSRYWIQFTDKIHSDFSLDNPLEFLSQKSLDRRTLHAIPLTENDLPVSRFYTDSLESLGLVILNRSRWFNAVTVYTTDYELIDTIHHLGFVANRQKAMKIKTDYSNPPSKFPVHLEPVFYTKKTGSDFYQYGVSGNQVKMMRGEFLHNSGFRGSGIDIAVIDAGFSGANVISSLSSLFQSGRILGTRDFVAAGNSVYNEHQHGTNVLSLIGGNEPGYLTGTAPEASFWLLRSEDDLSEYLIEEDNWVAAAEFADSAGVYIMNTSLGYTIFDNPLMNHTYQDMDGKTTRISIAAGIAASKGMLLFVSAGNDGNSSWRYISAPADNDSVLAIGAVTGSGSYASFSSRGPTYDGRIKPDVTAQGQAVVFQGETGAFFTGNGTSFSSPLVAGLAACLWQAYPQAKAWEIKNAIIKSASQYNNPDYYKGYGIPDFEKAFNLLDPGYKEPIGDLVAIKLFPNPTSGLLYLEALKDLPGTNKYSVTSSEGKTISTGTFSDLNRGEIIRLPFPENIRQGFFIVKVISQIKTEQAIVIKY
jgi:serine protease AprX